MLRENTERPHTSSGSRREQHTEIGNCTRGREYQFESLMFNVDVVLDDVAALQANASEPSMNLLRVF